MTEFDTLTADPAEETQDAASQPDETMEACEISGTAPLFCSPVLDRIRTSD